MQYPIMQHGWMLGVLGALVGCSSLLTSPADAAASKPIRQAIACPAQLQDLMPLLLRDLPSYANRVSQRAYERDRNPDVPGYVLLTGQPDYQPLPLVAGEQLAGEQLPPADSAIGKSSQGQAAPPQVFFTTLERQYVGGKAVELQHYHWLFLTPTESHGWRLVLMFSRIGNVLADQPPSPPEDASQGVIAQAIRLWLRDCRAGAIESKGQG
ncbi:MAG TPA: hypothetical protein V6C57_02450 [Coleofasciculaceae cyanobacterium]